LELKVLFMGSTEFGMVVIGRNEGDRLAVCLQSAIAQSQQVVYVDSGSTDQSIEKARSLSVEVVELDLRIPFTAARARNTGLARLLELSPELVYVQFLDGDCELVAGWCDRALMVLRDQPKVAVVCGRRRECFPQASVFNLLCDLEWNTALGEALACGGDALMRVAAMRPMNGYNTTLIAGEEPELCLRLRQQGWYILRIDHEMTWHDAHMMRLGQWWRRSVRAGHAYAEVSWLHRQEAERFWVRESLRIWGWGLGLPLLMLCLLHPSHGWSGMLGGLYLLLMVKIFGQAHDRHGTLPAFYYAIFCTLAKFPELQGQLWFHLNRLKGDRSALIEYK
jgi:glycosyltransferase involved in cell wall biosynthesis